MLRSGRPCTLAHETPRHIHVPGTFFVSFLFAKFNCVMDSLSITSFVIYIFFGYLHGVIDQRR